MAASVNRQRARQAFRRIASLGSETLLRPVMVRTEPINGALTTRVRSTNPAPHTNICVIITGSMWLSRMPNVVTTICSRTSERAPRNPVKVVKSCPRKSKPVARDATCLIYTRLRERLWGRVEKCGDNDGGITFANESEENNNAVDDDDDEVD